MVNPSQSSAPVGDERATLDLELLMAAMQLQSGPVPALFGEIIYDDGNFSMTRDGFRFVTPGGVEFGYRTGESVIAGPTAATLTDERDIYHWGTVFGAVAWLHRLLPLHASSVALDGQALAFTAASGGGKSTLAAALALQGFGLLCDDTLPLSIGEGQPTQHNSRQREADQPEPTPADIGQAVAETVRREGDLRQGRIGNPGIVVDQAEDQLGHVG